MPHVDRAGTPTGARGSKSSTAAFPPMQMYSVPRARSKYCAWISGRCCLEFVAADSARTHMRLVPAMQSWPVWTFCVSAIGARYHPELSSCKDIILAPSLEF